MPTLSLCRTHNSLLLISYKWYLLPILLSLLHPHSVIYIYSHIVKLYAIITNWVGIYASITTQKGRMGRRRTSADIILEKDWLRSHGRRWRMCAKEVLDSVGDQWLHLQHLLINTPLRPWRFGWSSTLVWSQSWSCSPSRHLWSSSHWCSLLFLLHRWCCYSCPLQLWFCFSSLHLLPRIQLLLPSHDA